MKNNISSVLEKNLIKKYPLFAFFGMAYVFFVVSLMIIGGIVSALSIPNIVMSLFVAIASWMPNIAAFVVLWVNKEPDGVRKLFAGWLRWRVPAGWYIFGLLPLAIAVVVAWGAMLLGKPSPGASTGMSASVLLSMVLFNVIQGATGEELGWRGFALPRLQARFSGFMSALILGLMIAGWHSILHLVSPVDVPEWQFWLILVCYSIVVAWGYNRSGSLLIVSLFHFSFNFGIELMTSRLGLISNANLFWGYVGVYLLGALGVILWEGKKILQRPI